MRHPDREPGVELVTDYGAGMGLIGPDEGLYARQGDNLGQSVIDALAERQVEALEEERDTLLDRAHEISLAIRRIKAGL